MTSEDPFDCFGDDGGLSSSDISNDDEAAERVESNSSATSSPQTPRATVSNSSTTRDPECGILKFHSGTEQSLWFYVERELDKILRKKKKYSSGSDAPAISIGREILKLVDEFCYRRHWMMAVGPEKGEILSDFLKEFCDKYQQRKSNENMTIVELGTYCGYSAILITLTILDIIPDGNFHIYSIDVDGGFQEVAKKLVVSAQLEKYITFILLPVDGPDDALTKALLNQQQQEPATTLSKIDFLFIDHDKDLYLSDLQQLEQSGLIQAGTHVAADNVVFFDIPYRSYLQQLRIRGIVESRLVESQLEYVIDGELPEASEPFQDGIELSIYLKDPL